MSGMTEPRELFLHELGDILYAEKVLVKSLPKLAKEATDPELAKGFEAHLEETKQHVANVELVFEQLGERVKAEPCPGIEGIKAEHDEFMKEEKPSKSITDLFLTGAAARTEHYEIAAYEGLVGMAKALGETKSASLLEQELEAGDRGAPKGDLSEQEADRQFGAVEGSGVSIGLIGVPAMKRAGTPIADLRSRTSRTLALPAAILDVDGTLVDTNYHHILAWARAFASCEIVLPLWRIHRHMGMGADKLLPALLGETMAEELGETVRQAERDRYLELIDEVRPLRGHVLARSPEESRPSRRARLLGKGRRAPPLSRLA